VAALRRLRRREARRQGANPLTYRELAAKTGWSHGIIGEYLTGRVLPPTDRFDVLVRLLGATPAEQGWLATARDVVEERRRAGAHRVLGQLPPAVPGFTGRGGPLAELDRLIDPDARGTTPLTTVSGTAGVGKPNPEIDTLPRSPIDPIRWVCAADVRRPTRAAWSCTTTPGAMGPVVAVGGVVVGVWCGVSTAATPSPCSWPGVDARRGSPPVGGVPIGVDRRTSATIRCGQRLLLN
jgi:hypothetical protein